MNESIGALVESAQEQLCRGDYKTLSANDGVIRRLTEAITGTENGTESCGIACLIQDHFIFDLRKDYTNEQINAISYSLNQLMSKRPDLNSCLDRYRRAGLKIVPV